MSAGIVRSECVIRRQAEAAAWKAQFGAKSAGGTLEPVGGKAPADARLAYSSEGVRFELRADEGKLAEPVATARKRYLAQFADADADGSGSLDEKELAPRKAGPFLSPSSSLPPPSHDLPFGTRTNSMPKVFLNVDDL